MSAVKANLGLFRNDYQLQDYCPLFFPFFTKMEKKWTKDNFVIFYNIVSPLIKEIPSMAEKKLTKV